MSGPSPGQRQEPSETGESSFELSGNLTDITGDRSFLIDLASDVTPRDSFKSIANESDFLDREDQLFGNISNKYSTPEKCDDSTLLINEEIGRDPLPEEYGKRKRSDSDDSNKIAWQGTTDESVNSAEHSDRDTSSKDESDFSIEGNETKKKNEVKKKVTDDLPSTVSVLKTRNGAMVYVVGTAHFSEESQDDVSKVIKKVQPHIIVVELCSQRINILKLDEKTILEEAKNTDFKKMKAIIEENGLFNSIMYILLLNMSAHITKQLGIAPGGEFRRALQEACNVPNCIIHLGDRPIQITMHRALSALSWWQIVKLIWKLLTNKDPISKDDVEQCKQSGFLQEMLADMEKEFPALSKVFLDERDIFLTHSLQMAASANAGNVPTRVVGVVGLGHVRGILANWERVTPEKVAPIMIIPPTSTSSRVIKTTFKIATVGLIVYVGYKFVPKIGFQFNY